MKWELLFILKFNWGRCIIVLNMVFTGREKER